MGPSWSCCAAPCSSTRSTSRWSASRCRPSAPTSACPPSSLQWVVSGYVLGYGGLLLLGGRAADLLGRRRVFLAALAVFAVASLLGGLVSSAGPAHRRPLRQGRGGGVHRPGRPVHHHHHVRRGPASATGRSASTRPSAPAASRSAWCCPACSPRSAGGGPCCCPRRSRVLVLAAAAAADPARRSGRPAAAGRFDLPGAVTVTAAMLLLVYAVVGAPQAGWASARTHRSFAGAAALLGAFVVDRAAQPRPAGPLGILRSGALARANLGAMALFGSYVSFQFLVTQYLQILAGWSALATALAFLPAGVLVAVASTRMGPLLDRFGPARVIAVGFACLVAGYACVPADRPAPRLPDGDPAVAAADRRGVRARLLRAEHPGHRGRGRPRAGPGLRPPADLVPGRRRDRARRRHRGGRRPRRPTRLAAPRRRSPPTGPRSA